MNRETLTKIGDPIRIWRDRDGRPTLSYYLVGSATNPIGIGLFHFTNTFCTAAIVKDAGGREMLIERYDDDHPVGEHELEYLFEIYKWAYE